MVTIKHEIAIKLLFVYAHAHGSVNFLCIFYDVKSNILGTKDGPHWSDSCDSSHCHN